MAGQRRNMSSVRTLDEIGARASMLQLTCSRCECHGRYRLNGLIGCHGADATVRAIVAALTDDCPQRDSAALMELCDLLFPELRTPFGAR